MDIGERAPSRRGLGRLTRYGVGPASRESTMAVYFWRSLRACTFLTRTRWFRPSSSTRPSPVGHAIYEVPQWLAHKKAQEDARRWMHGRQEWEMFLIFPSARCCLMALAAVVGPRATKLTRHRHQDHCLDPWLRRPYHVRPAQASQSWRSAGTNSHNNNKRHVCPW